MVVVSGIDNHRFYSPYIDGALPGIIPAQWGDTHLLWPMPGLTQIAFEASAKLNTGVALDPYEMFLQVRARAENEGWYHLEHVKGSGS